MWERFRKTRPCSIQATLPPEPQRRQQHAGLALALRAVERLTSDQLEALAAAAAERASPLTAALALRQLEALARQMPHTAWQIPASGALLGAAEKPKP